MSPLNPKVPDRLRANSPSTQTLTSNVNIAAYGFAQSSRPNPRRRIAAALLFAAVSLLCAHPSEAQWQNLHTFNSHGPDGIVCVYFLPGPPTVGFVGTLNGYIYRTTDGGTSWNQCTTISGTATTITSFCFKDSLVGWLSCGYGNSPIPGCWKTTDGGLTWRATTQMGGKPSVFYNKASRRLFLIGWYTNPASYSTDDGVTWTALPYSTYNASAFLSDSVGIISNTVLSTNPFYLATTDGGLTWRNSPLDNEAWQPLALPCQGVYFALSEITGKLYRSNDSAKSWNLIHTFSPATGSGMIAGDYNHLITQLTNGVYVSMDQGVTWTSIGGPSSAQWDNRFFVADGVIYAGSTTGTLFKYSLGLSSTFAMSLSSDTLALSSSPCFSGDSEITFTGPGACQEATLLSVTPLDTTNFSVSTSVPLPAVLDHPITIHVTLKPGTGSSATTTVRIHYAILNGTHDTTVYLTGQRGGSALTSLGAKGTSLTAQRACTTADSGLYVWNPSCDTIWVTHVSVRDSIIFSMLGLSLPIAIPPDDSLRIDVKGSAKVPGSFSSLVDLTYRNRTASHDTTLPVVLRVINWQRPSVNVSSIDFPDPCIFVDSSLTIQNPTCDTLIITGVSISDTTDFALALDSLAANGLTFPIIIPPSGGVRLPFKTKARYAVRSNGTIFVRMTESGISLDTSIIVTFSAVGITFPQFATPIVDFPDPCPAADSSFTITNPGCDTLIVTAATLSGTSDFNLAGMSFPIILPPGGRVRVPILSNALRKEQVTASLDIQTLHRGIPFDTTIALTLSIKNGAGSSVALAPATPDAGSVSTCASKDVTIYVTNPLCVGTVLDSVSLSNASNAFTILSGVSNVALPSGAVDTIVVHFSPSRAGSQQATLNLHFTAPGLQYDTTIQIAGTGVSTLSTALTDQLLKFDTITPCESGTLSTYLVNLSCDSINLLGLLPNLTPSFQLLAPTFPQWLKQGDSVLVTVRLSPGTTGPLQDSMVFDATDATGAQTYATLALEGVVVKGLRDFRLSTSQLSMDSVPGCVASDTEIVLRNLAACDSVRIDSVSISGSPELLLIGVPSLPATLLLGDSAGFTVRVRPGEHQVLTGMIHIYGPGIDTTISIHVSSLSAGSNTLALAGKTKYQVHTCTSEVEPVVIANNGCSAMAIDSLSLASLTGGATRFSFLSTPVLPIQLAAGDSLVFMVVFDGGAFGDSTAILTALAGGRQFTKSIVLQGSILQPPDLHVDVLTENGSKRQDSPAGTRVSAIVSIRDSVPSNANLKSVSFRLVYNRNVLTIFSVTPASGWGISNRVNLGDTLLVLLVRSDTGAIAQGTPLLNVSYKLTLGDTMVSNVQLLDLKLNETDTNYARCTLAAVQPPPAQIGIAAQCGDSTIVDFMHRERILSGATLNPNPAGARGSGQESTALHFTLATDADVSVQLSDALGRTTSEPDRYSLKVGEHEIPLSIATLAEGLYFVRIEAGGVSAVVKLVVKH